jgi:glycosyltransferase involved in cell wall biosynthesis
MRDFELIIVDQNSDDRILPIIQQWTKDESRSLSIPIKHLHCPPGVSRARNLGLMHSLGEILAFPDDDCWYQPDTLKYVDNWFKENQEYGILSLGCRDENGRVSMNSWWQRECDINWGNVIRTTATFSYFMRRPKATFPLLFDESIGPGASLLFGCGEDTDFVITLMNFGIRGKFCSIPYVGHPYRGGFIDTERAKRYGGGFGRVLAKHSCRFLFLGFVAFDFMRSGAHRLLGKRTRSSELWAHGTGMIRAYFSD